MKKKLVIFDLDGTLLQTIEDITDSLNYSLDFHGFSTYSKEDVISFIGSGMDKLIMRSLDSQSKTYTQDDFINVKNTYSDYYNNHNTIKTKPFDGIIEVLEELKKSYLVAVCSNKPYQDTLKVVNTYFGDIFDYVYGYTPKFKIKPSPEVIYHICESLNVNLNDAILIGDSEVDIKCAKNSNIDSILCMWGYLHLKDLDGCMPTYMVESPKEILEKL